MLQFIWAALRSAFLVSLQSVTTMLTNYLSRFSAIGDNKINCGPVLTWMEVIVIHDCCFFMITLISLAIATYVYLKNCE